MLHIATEDEIKNGKVTDVYFVRTKKILEEKKIYKRVKAEFAVKTFPVGYSWSILAGIEECVQVLQTLDNIEVDAMQEGTIFEEDEPVLVIEGDYTKFGIYETCLLGFLCQASGIATKSARCKKAAGLKRQVISFGARRMHPVIAPMVERNAYIGGCDGVACIKSAEKLGIEPIGTIPHALVLLIGSSIGAMQAFHKIIDSKINRVALVDTLQDEKFEAISVSKEFGNNLFAIRLDTPSSRRGDFFQILKEVRWELDLRGFKNVKLLISGGIDEYKILELNPVVNAYGIGTSISNAPVLDFAMDIVEIEGEPVAKRGKLSGSKATLLCPKCRRREIIPETQLAQTKCECGAEYENLLKPLIVEGKLVQELPEPQDIREYVLEQLNYYEIA